MALQDDISAILTAFGLQELTDYVVNSQKEGKDDLTLLTELRQRPEYKARFPAMAELQRKAQGGVGATAVAIDEGQYLQMERAYRQVFQNSGLPMNMWDTPDDFKRLLESDIAPPEVQDRIAAAKEAVDSTDPNVRNQLLSLYNISSTELVAYALDPDKNEALLRRMSTTARLAGYSQSAGLASMSKGLWEGYAQDLINQQVGDAGLRGVISDADTLAESQSRLASIEGGDFSTEDALDITVRKNADKALASRQRVERERARWAAQTGVSATSLAKPGI